MKVVKLYASASTNEDLRVRFRESELPNLTTLYTHIQTDGKGQRGARWESEDYKNLTFSILVKDLERFPHWFSLNKLVSIALVTWLAKRLHVTAKIKWPNDIVSVNHKLAGILIETIFKGPHKQHAIIGIGLNVNQTVFTNAPKAISLKQITGQAHDLEVLLHSFLAHFEYCYQQLTDFDGWYVKHMFRHQKLQEFIIAGATVTALVEGVDHEGKLLLKQHDKVTAYDLKEVQWVY